MRFTTSATISMLLAMVLTKTTLVEGDTTAKPSGDRTTRVKSVSIKIIDQEKFPAPRKNAEDDSITVDFPFKGKIHAPGTEGYTLARQKNYAYNSKYADEMYPAYFVYPENGELESIISAIEFGRRSGLHVMGRSGGHQYCGSSSDSGSVIIDMQEWDDIGEVVDSRATVGSKLAKKYKKMITVGAGASLGELSKKLAAAGCTIPMGECPSVCVGGHIQTGGWGHLARSNGLFSEYVYGFTIVTSEGLKKVSCKSLGRELDLYNAVRGGSPGAFGIITDVTFLLLSDDSYPNSRAYGQIILIRDDEDYEVIDSLMKLFLKTMNDVGNSSKAQGVTLNFSHIARAIPSSTVFTKIQKIFPILRAKLFQRVEVLMIEATIVDDTDASSMEVFQDVVDATDVAIERMKRRWIDFCIVAGMRLITPKTFKDGKTRAPLSTINESYVREYPIVSKKTETNPQQRVNEHPYQGQAIYPKEHVHINVDEFVEGNKDSSSNGGKMGLLALYKSITSLVGPHMPLDEIASQSYLLGTKRGMGPFPCTAQWMTEIRGTIGFDQWGTKEGLSDPRTWKIRQAFYDLEREYMLRENEIPCCPAAFTSDASGDTSLGRCVKDSESLNLTKESVQKRYYVPESKQGFGWVSSVKYDWDREDIFHSRFTVPPCNKPNL